LILLPNSSIDAAKFRSASLYISIRCAYSRSILRTPAVSFCIPGQMNLG